MDNTSDEKDLTHSDLSFLNKLRKYTFDSKMCICQRHSSRIMSISQVDPQLILEYNITPWELEAFAAFSVIFDDENALEEIDDREFSDTITLLRNYWHPELTLAEENGTYADVFMMISELQQFPVQGLFLQKLFRCHYFFNFKNDDLDMATEFQTFFNADYRAFEIFAFILFISCSHEGQNKAGRENCGAALCKAIGIKEVLSSLSIHRNTYKSLLEGQYKEKLLDYYYGLKIQYLYPIIEGLNCCYIPSPYLVINAVTESLINRLTLNNNSLRKKFGKEVIENYLFSIYAEVPTVSWIHQEFEYYVGRRKILTPDVLAAESDYAIFFDTKALSPNLKMRQFDNEEIAKETKIYAEDIIQIHHRILDYVSGHFKLDKEYDQQHVFGVVVVLEDAAVARHLVYDKVFELLQENHIDDTLEIRNYIHSHIKIVPLRQIEEMVLIGHSYLQCLLQQVNKPEHWDDYTYFIPTNEFKLIPSYNVYCDSIKKDAGNFLTK